jgi:adhesin/invasin
MAAPTSLAFRLTLISALATACGGGDLGLPDQGEPAQIDVVAGDRQNATVGQAAGEPLVVRVTDRFGDPVPEVPITWSAEGGGSVIPSESTTGEDGRASTQRILGGQPGTYFTPASATGLPDPATFTTLGLSARLVITSELPAIAVSGVPLSPQPTLQLEDADGSPIARADVVVTVQINSGGGSLIGSTSATSDEEGQVAFTDLAIRGSPGARQLIFAAESFASAISAPIALGVGTPASIEAVAGDDQSAPAGTAVPIDPSVRIRDADGNPLPGIPVKFAVTAGDGEVSGETPLTGSDGVATVGEWRLGGQVGSNTLSASVSGQSLSGSPVVFSATAVPGTVSAERSTVTANPATIGASNGSSASTITVTARDAFGNPVPGVEVTLAASGGSENNLVQPTAATSAGGVATGRFSSTVLGSRTISATAGGVAVQQTATVTVGAGVPSASNSSATVPPNGQSGVATTIEVRLEDAFGHPVAGARGSIGVQISGSNPSAPVDITDQGGGLYHVRYTPIVAGEDAIGLRVEGTPIPGSPFRSAIAPGPVSPSASTATVSAQSGGFFVVISAVITARDAQGNPVGHGGNTVTMTVPGRDAVQATDRGNGTYEAVDVGFGTAFDVIIQMDGVQIQGSPFHVVPGS